LANQGDKPANTETKGNGSPFKKAQDFKEDSNWFTKGEDEFIEDYLQPEQLEDDFVPMLKSKQPK
jgi:hypothetical protein